MIKQGPAATVNACHTVFLICVLGYFLNFLLLFCFISVKKKTWQTDCKVAFCLTSFSVFGGAQREEHCGLTWCLYVYVYVRACVYWVELFPFQSAQTWDLWLLSVCARKMQTQRRALKGLLVVLPPQTPPFSGSFGAHYSFLSLSHSSLCVF